jgi:uncharacterized membrane protein YdcZ (DUF606 family)
MYARVPIVCMSVKFNVFFACFPLLACAQESTNSGCQRVGDWRKWEWLGGKGRMGAGSWRMCDWREG